jgi:hypothetical protein
VKLNNQHTNITDKGEGKLSPFYYIEDGKYVFTEEYHKQRGYCCGNGCRHCCYEPKHLKGNTTIKKE